MRKKLILLLLSTVLFVFANAQVYVQKNMVLIEIATGTWCGYCPGAAMAVDQMTEEELSVAVIENHGGDSFENSGSAYRNNFYDIGGYPTAKFNGAIEFIGGASTNIYSTYKGIYDKSVTEQTYYSLSLDVESLGLNHYSATVHSNNLGKADEDSIHLFIVLTESNIEYSWMDQNELNFVNRFMVVGNQGEHICYSCSGTYHEVFEFTIDPSWNADNMEVVAFIQEVNNKEVYNSAKSLLPELVIQNDVGFIGDIQIYDMDCKSEISPEISVINSGKEALEVLTIAYSVNAGTELFYDWSGYLAEDSVVNIQLPEFEFNGLNGENTINIRLVEPNGVDDEIPGNNYSSKTFYQTLLKNQFLEVKVATDYNGEETSWELYNDDGDVVLNGGNYELGQEYRTFIEPENNSCYTFVCYDAGNNGMGQDGYIRLIDYRSQSVIFDVPEFTNAHSIQFTTDYSIEKTLDVRNKYGKLVGLNDTVFVNSFMNDSAFTESFRILNQSPLSQFLNISIQQVSGNDSIESLLNVNNNEVFSSIDSVLIEGGSDLECKTVFKPHKASDSKLIKCKVWVANDTTDSFSWFVSYVSKELPPVNLQLMHVNERYLQRSDTIIIEDYAIYLQDTLTRLYLENNSSISVNIAVESEVVWSEADHDFSFNWLDSDVLNIGDDVDAVILQAGDTLKTFSSIFSANNFAGDALVSYKFYDIDNIANNTRLYIKYVSVENKAFGMSIMANGEILERDDTIKYNLLASSQNRIITDLTIKNTGNYDYNVGLERTIINGLGEFIDSTFWGDRFYLGANMIFSEEVLMEEDGQVSCKLVFDPPFVENELLIHLRFFEWDNEDNSYDVYVNYIIEQEVGINDNFEDNIRIYPNPANDLLYLNGNVDEFECEMYNIQGVVVYKKQGDLSNGPCVFDIENLEQGIYILNVKSSSGIFSSRFVKK